MSDQDSALGAFGDKLAELGHEGEQLLQDRALGLDERAILQRAVGYLLEARLALEELATRTA